MLRVLRASVPFPSPLAKLHFLVQLRDHDVKVVFLFNLTLVAFAILLGLLIVHFLVFLVRQPNHVA